MSYTFYLTNLKCILRITWKYWMKKARGPSHVYLCIILEASQIMNILSSFIPSNCLSDQILFEVWIYTPLTGNGKGVIGYTLLIRRIYYSRILLWYNLKILFRVDKSMLTAVMTSLTDVLLTWIWLATC